MWVADAKSLLASSNCFLDCSQDFDIAPSLEFVGYADSLKPADMLTINVHEFAFSATMRNELLSLNYIDMVAIYERIH